VLGDPEWQGQVSANVTKGIFNVGYRMRLIGRTVVSGAYETQNSFQGRPPKAATRTTQPAERSTSV